MEERKIKTALKEIAGIVLLSIVLALSFNLLSPRGIPLLRKDIQKTEVPDSLLFNSIQGEEGNLPEKSAGIGQKSGGLKDESADSTKIKNKPITSSGGEVTSSDKKSANVTKPGDKTTVTSGDKTTMTSGNKTTVISGDKTTVTSGDKTTVKPGDKTAVTSGDKTTVKPGDKTTVTSGDKTTVTSGNKTTTQSGKDSKQAMEKTSRTSTGQVIKQAGESSPVAVKDNRQSVSTSGEKSKIDEIKVISLRQFKRIISERKPLIIDARDPESFKNGRIPGSINYFGDDPTQHFESLLNIQKDTLVVVYCNNKECHLGHSMIEFMKTIEFTNIYLYDNGWDEWVAEKMPIEK